MKHISRGVFLKKAGFKVLGYSLVCISFITGCANKKLEQPYSFEERASSFVVSVKAEEPEAFFAADLAVITDEAQYADEAITADAAVLCSIDSGSVLYSKEALERMNPASTTKVMTALLAIKYGNLSDKVTVTEEAVIAEAGATLCGIKPGDVLTLEQLLYGLMLPSGNDAGNAIAVHMAGSVESFSEMMNQEAKRLGATGTHFMNPHGLTDEEHYTTAYDLYLIFNEALKQPEFREVTQTTAYTAEYTDASGESVSTVWKGGNWYLVDQREEPEGLTVFSGKTGTTNAAGYCLVMATKDSDNKEYISVVLKADSRPGLYDNMTNIIRKIVD